jgi:hypothetical protein
LSIQKPQANIVVKKILLGNYLGLFLSFHFEFKFRELLNFMVLLGFWCEVE